MNTIEILHISDCLDGGVPAVIDTLLSRDGSQALFLGELRADLNQRHLCTCIPGYERTFHPIKFFKFLLVLRARIKEFNPKIIHLHSSYAGLLGVLAALGLNLPVIYSPHASPMMMPAPGMKLRIIRRLEKITSTLARCVIACSKDEAAYFGGKTRVITIPNGVPDRVIRVFEELLQKNSGFTYDIIGVGRDSEQKDLEQFSNIAELVLQQLPNARIAWLGAAGRAGLSDKVTWLGYVSEHEVEQVLSQSQIFLATSQYEGFSVASIKAGIAGCQLVLRNTPGTRALILDGTPGVLFHMPEECAARIVPLIRDGLTITARVHQGSLTAQNYSQDLQIRRTEILYKEFL